MHVCVRGACEGWVCIWVWVWMVVCEGWVCVCVCDVGVEECV